MKGYSKWSFCPYIPYDRYENRLLPYICRLAPHPEKIEGEWLNNGCNGKHTLFYAERNSENWQSLTLSGKKFLIEGLNCEVDYKLYIEAENGTRSNLRLCRTCEVPGVVVNYLHPGDVQYDFSGKYLCSPSMERLPDGTLLASMDLYCYEAPQNLTLIFSSKDEGKSWEYLCEIFPCFWGKLFWHKDALYMLGMSNEYGDLLIGRSDDGGKTFGTPTVIMRGSACSRENGPHKAPMGIIKSGGRLWTAVDYGSWSKGSFKNGFFSIDENADLLVAENWNCTGFIGAADNGAKRSAIEGNAVEAPDGSIINIIRNDENTAVIIGADKEHPERLPEFIKTIDFPMGHTKFEILKKNGEYFAIGNRLPLRNILSVYISKDAEKYEFMKDIINRKELSKDFTGFQYPAALHENNELLVLSRTSFSHAHSFHDSNMITFHRIIASDEDSFTVDRFEGDFAFCKGKNGKIYKVCLSTLPKGICAGDRFSDKDGKYALKK